MAVSLVKKMGLGWSRLSDNWVTKGITDGFWAWSASKEIIWAVANCKYDLSALRTMLE